MVPSLETSSKSPLFQRLLVLLEFCVLTFLRGGMVMGVVLEEAEPSR